jgi:hypothetical protein
MDKKFYINDIMSKLNEKGVNSFDFNQNTMIQLWYLGEVVDNILLTLYVNQNNVLCLTTMVFGEYQTDRLFDFGNDEVKIIYALFIEQFKC